ncbi:MAG: FHA domain-containing protein [Propionibacteriaceae bacterium]|jgi:hypothetical protein|nr:FHA domain-containing protein [Propionibacteriaceae bacterium]
MTAVGGGFTYATGDVVAVANWPSCLLIDLSVDDPRLPTWVAMLSVDDPIAAISQAVAEGSSGSSSGSTPSLGGGPEPSVTPSFAAMVVGSTTVTILGYGRFAVTVDGVASQFSAELTRREAPAHSEVAFVGHGTTDAGSGAAGGWLELARGSVLADRIVWPGSSDDSVEAQSDSSALASAIDSSVAGSATGLIEDTMMGFEHLLGIVGPNTAAQNPSTVDSARTAQSDGLGGVAPANDPGMEAGDDADHGDAEDPGRTQVAISTIDLAQAGIEIPSGETQTTSAEDWSATNPEPRSASGARRSSEPPAFIESFDWRGTGEVPEYSAVRRRADHESARSPSSPVPTVAPPPAVVPPEFAPAPSAPRVAPTSPVPSPPVAALPSSTELIIAPAHAPAEEATVRRTALTPIGGSGEVMVVAFVCPQGHHSPPYAQHCRVCGAVLDQNQPVLEVPRPALGILRLWVGGTILLDRGVVFGRNPHAVPGVVGPQPHLIRIDDPNRDISSQHCEIRLEDWFVTVRDLSSTNGTQVILPHRPPVALRTNEPMTLEPGTRVVLASAFDFVFEVA